MSLRRFMVRPPLLPGPAVLEGEEARHLRLVLRGRGGDAVALCDGAGRDAEAVIVDVGRDRVTCRVAGPVRETPPPRCRIELVCALPRAGAADDVVRVATEVGATAIRPLVAERGVWVPGDESEQRPERFARAAAAALKQSGLSWMPELLPAAVPGDLAFAAGDLALLGSTTPAALPLRDVLGTRLPVPRVFVIVGPEGGLTQGEGDLLVAKGAVPVRVGPGILRVETAVVALLAHVVGACR